MCGRVRCDDLDQWKQLPYVHYMYMSLMTAYKDTGWLAATVDIGGREGGKTSDIQ